MGEREGGRKGERGGGYEGEWREGVREGEKRQQYMS